MMKPPITIAAPSRPESKAEEGKPTDERTRKLRSLRDGLQRNTVAVTRIIDELIAELESDQEAA